MDIKRVLVIGGTGMLGRPVVHQLAQAGFAVTVGTRSADHARDCFGGSMAIAEIDLADRNSIRRALDGEDAAHLNLPSGPRFEDCFRNDTAVCERVAGVAGEVGLKRISYLSGVTVGPGSEFPPAQAKWRAEEALRASGVPFTIWRATWFMETLSLLARHGVMIILGRGDQSAHWLAGTDFGAMVAQALQTPRAGNKTLYAYGPERRTLREAVTIYRDSVHPRRPIISAPLGPIIALRGIIPNREAWFGAQLMRQLERIGEPGDPTEAWEITGRPETTVAMFARSAGRAIPA